MSKELPFKIDDSNPELCDQIEALWEKSRKSGVTFSYMNFAEDVMALAVELMAKKASEEGVTSAEMQRIRLILGDEYSEAEIDDMLNKATFEKTAAGVTVTYDNGVKDHFRYHQVLEWASNLR